MEALLGHESRSVSRPDSARSNQIGWIALTLTPGLGPTRSRKLIEFFGGVEAVLQASLTGTRSGRTAGAVPRNLSPRADRSNSPRRNRQGRCRGRATCTLDDPAIPLGCGKSTIRRWCCIFAAMSRPVASPESRLSARVIPRLMVSAWPSVWHATWRPADWSFLAAWRAAWIRPPSRRLSAKGKTSRCLAPAWM